jgi:N-acetylmuramoyl-L-alanine amidase
MAAQDRLHHREHKERREEADAPRFDLDLVRALARSCGMRSRLLLIAVVAAIAAAFGAVGCRTPSVEDAAIAKAWTPAAVPQARWLAGVFICIDPGHGGDVGDFFERTKYKRGPTGLREAEVNLRTAEFLRDMLEAAGAKVLMTRTADVDVPLEERVSIANASGCDLFLSIHHNHAARPTANFGSVWYHRDGAASPASLDVARFLSDALVRTVQPDEPQYSGIYSDTLMYADGFAVLRGAAMPAVLAECLFYSNPAEEERLRDPRRNEQVARGLFLGLCDWAANGIPRWSFGPDPPAKGPAGTRSICIAATDGMKEPWGNGELRLRSGSLSITADGEAVDAYTIEGRDIWALVPENAKVLDVRFENRAKNSSITSPQQIPH